MFLKCPIILIFLTEISSYTVEVKVKPGKLRGIREETVTDGRHYYAFYGVPYAQSPVGKLRFKDPKPPKKWKTTFDATVEYHGACAQSHLVHKHALFGYEDCLSLNVYSAHIPKEKDEKLQPVAVWIHGYGFAASLSHIFGGDSFLDKNIVFVTVTHRIGVFGFLKSNISSPGGNMGLKDIVMALKWIRKNIKHFGGDKRRITVMGNDSGASFLSLLLMTKYRNMFAKMILQSGTIFAPSMYKRNANLERDRFLRNLQNVGYRDISTAPTKDIILASQKIYTSKEIINFQRPVVPFSPTIDISLNESFLSLSPDEFYNNAKNFNVSKSILLGFNNAESISEIIPFLHNTRYLNYFSPIFKYMIPYSDGCIYNYTTKIYTKIANKIKHYYFKEGISEKSFVNFLRYTTDLRKYPIWKFIQKLISLKTSKIFVYKFSYVGGLNTVKATSLAGTNIKVKGASNGDEICYILRCEPLTDKYIKTNNDTTIQDRKFMTKITEMWANFIRRGDPTLFSQSGNIVWPAMTLKEKNILKLGKDTKLINSKLEDETFSFWEDIYTMYYANYSNCAQNIHEEL
ncbi:unnamed protein product [Chilo suppressalis]|uniref:Carboxylesterase type B domain-containing protein n=1 Tax=Chilo suppressalis TaxID=168631 RepID=A0ABN8AZL5_CHISP|nr:unnamed protein product [Chilo suppressalis]